MSRTTYGRDDDNIAKMPADVLLLRSPSEDGGPDKYEEAFRERGYRAVSIPVLETVHTNVEKLADVLRGRGRIAPQAGDVEEARRYAGVVVTSGRACETWRHVVEQLAKEDHHGSEGTTLQVADSVSS